MSDSVPTIQVDLASPQSPDSINMLDELKRADHPPGHRRQAEEDEDQGLMMRPRPSAGTRGADGTGDGAPSAKEQRLMRCPPLRSHRLGTSSRPDTVQRKVLGAGGGAGRGGGGVECRQSLEVGYHSFRTTLTLKLGYTDQAKTVNESKKAANGLRFPFT
ncbi:hypothetical protein CRUP_038504 [Coryphaenoides rupestris]|nr:hypothetical protein CRUP_038504 [Coryphaenoides rupestris]